MCLANENDITIKFVNKSEILLFGKGKVNKKFIKYVKYPIREFAPVLVCKVIDIKTGKTKYMNYTNTDEKY